MKRRVGRLIKRIMAAMSTKTNELRTRITIFFLLHRNQTLLLDKFQAVIDARRKAASSSSKPLYCGDRSSDDDDDDDGEGESFAMYMNTEPKMCISTANQVSSYTKEMNAEEDMNKRIDLTHILLKESEEEMKKGGVDISEEDRASKNTTTATMEIMEDGKLEEVEEEDIDHAADMFIERFRRQILLQKQLSLQENRSPARILQLNL